MPIIISSFRYLLCAMWTILMISSSMVIMVITFNRKIPVIMARTMFAPGILWASGIRLKVRGKEKLSKEEPYVFIANHLSYLDIPVLFRALPHNLHFVAKKQIKHIPFIGWYMMATGMIFVDRSNRVKSKESMDRAANLVSKGKDVLIFPEGTRSGDGQLQSFKKGAFGLAKAANVAVVPVAISGTERVLPPGRFTMKPSGVVVNIGTPRKMENEDLHTFTESQKTNVINLKKEIKKF